MTASVVLRRSPAERGTMTRIALGRDVLGPVLAEFMLRLWAFSASLPRPDSSRLLFCARGGLRLKLLYSDLLARSGLTAPVAFDDLMVSRLVAVRPALLRRETAAMDELGREFAGATLGEAAHAVAQCDLELGAEWSAPFSKSAFADRIWSGEPTSRMLLDAVGRQHDLFRRHLDARRGDAHCVILCDTGLNGSTLKLLSTGMPDIDLSCVLFARSNYKGFDVSHFARTAGLAIESDAYSLLYPRSTIFRYWQLIEHVLEPQLPSVRTFSACPEGEEPRSNLQIPGWSDAILPQPAEIFAGVRAYVQTLPQQDLAAQVYRDAAKAWSELGRLIARPRTADLDALSIGERSRDFGRLNAVPTLAVTGRGLRASIKDVRASLWKEGRIVEAHPRLGCVLLLGIEAAYLARALRRRLVLPSRPLPLDQSRGGELS